MVVVGVADDRGGCGFVGSIWVGVFFFFFLLLWTGDRWWRWWLWVWLMVKDGAVEVFLGSGIYYFIVVVILFYCDVC